MRNTQQPGELGRVGRLARRVRLALGVTAGALVLAVVAVAIAVAALLPEQAVHRPGSWIPLGLSLLAVAGGAFVVVVARRYLDDSRERVLVPEVERSLGLRRGQLAGALELVTPTRGGSVTLARLGRDRVADALAAREDWELFPETLRRVGRRIMIAGVLFTLGIGGLALMAARAPARTAKAAEALSRPWTTAFPPPPPRIQVAPGDTAVLRGDPLGVRAVAALRDSVALTWQAEAEPIRRNVVPVDDDGAARGEIGPVDAPTTYWVEGDDGSRSAAFEVLPLDPLLVTQLSVELRYPPYLGRPAETLGAPGDVLEVPAGTLVRIRGRTNAPLAAAALTDSAADGRVAFEVEGDRFSADWRPRGNGSWAWMLEPTGELPGLSPPPPFEIRVVPDLMPEILISYPGRDTAASVDLRLPLVVDARDDIGLAVVDLETWRVSAAGLRSESQAVPLWEAATVRERIDRLVLRPVLRLDALDLVPGDTLFYTARASDGNPGHAAARSDTFKVYVPTMRELRRSAAETASDLARGGRELQEDAADLARAARDAERRSSGRDRTPSERSAQDEADFGATEEARRVLERGEDLDERVTDLRRELEEMRDGAEDSGMSDAALREKMEQLDELFRQIEETGLGERLRQLEEALRNLDQPRTRQELGELSNTLRELESRLERTLSLMERVATEQSMKEAVEAARQLADRQSSLAESFDDTGAWAEAEAAAAEDAGRLAGQMEELRERLAQQGLDAAADSVGQGMQAASAAAGEMREASEAARGRGAQQQSAGEQSAASAAGRMSEAAELMEQAGQMLNEDWKQEALEAIERATGEALDLAGEQGALADELAAGAMDPADLAGRQTALVQGLDQLLESLSEAGRKTALIDETVGRSASQARGRMQELGESLSAREGPARAAAAEGRALVETLNDLAGRLMASRQQVENAGSATGMEELLDQLAQMSQSQAGLNRESGGLMLMQQGGQPMAVQMRRLAERQQEIARQLEELAQRPEAQELPARPDLLSAEAGEIASELRGGTLDRQTLERQERLFRRLLDAGRSLERDEDPSRRASQAADLSRPGAVPEPRGEIESGPRYPYPSDSALTGVSNAARRLILDYFDRLNATAGGPDTGGGP
jgi:hypothetical protein